METREVVDPKDVRPVGKNILVRRHAANEELIGGLIATPEDRIERSLRCTVLAVNKGTFVSEEVGYIPNRFQPGSVVLIRQWRGIPLNAHDESVIFVKDELVEAIDREAVCAS